MRILLILLLGALTLIPTLSAAEPDAYQVLARALVRKQLEAKGDLLRGVSRKYEQYIIHKSGTPTLENSWIINLDGVKYEYLAEGVKIYADSKHRLVVNQVNRGLIIQRRFETKDSSYIQRIEHSLSTALPKRSIVKAQRMCEIVLGDRKYIEIGLTIELAKNFVKEDCYILDASDSSMVGSKVRSQVTNKVFYNVEVSNSRLYFGLPTNVLNRVFSKSGKLRKDFIGYKIVRL